jgi:hypothetical protein
VKALTGEERTFKTLGVTTASDPNSDMWAETHRRTGRIFWNQFSPIFNVQIEPGVQACARHGEVNRGIDYVCRMYQVDE